MITDTLFVDVAEFEARTGWELKPEGACKGEICVPVGDAVTDGRLDLAAIAQALSMGIAHDEARGKYALGPETLGGRALATAVAPNLVLPTVDGDEFELASLRGTKVLLVAWSPY